MDVTVSRSLHAGVRIQDRDSAGRREDEAGIGSGVVYNGYGRGAGAGLSVAGDECDDRARTEERVMTRGLPCHHLRT
ncbi:MAG: hypothetical protein LUP97_03225 [Methanoregula sp.]|nr:hypothetical protein [Methanoregula sp.]